MGYSETRTGLPDTLGEHHSVQQLAKPLVQRLDFLPRKQPVQQRAKQRVERILDATAELLEGIGFDSITTNLIAERAGVDVASVYQYFPNK